MQDWTMEAWLAIPSGLTRPKCIECARGSFDLDAELAFGEENRFADFAPLAGGDLFPLGEVDDGHAFLGIDRVGRVYLVGNDLALEGNNIRAALDAILVGRLPTWLSD